MDTVKDFEIKQRKYMPVFPKASGKPTVSILKGIRVRTTNLWLKQDFHAEQINYLI